MWGITLEELYIFGIGIYKMRWWLFPIVLIFVSYGLCEAIENKWEERNRA